MSLFVFSCSSSGVVDWPFGLSFVVSLQGMELELRKLEEAVGSIHSEMLYLRERYCLCYLNLS